MRQAFLRSLDTAGVVSPQRTVGGRRRYTRRQLAVAARIRELLDQGHTLAAASRSAGTSSSTRTLRGSPPPP